MKRRISIIISLAYVLFMIILFILYLIKGEDYRYQVAIGGIICGAIPSIIERFAKASFNTSLIIAYILFLFGSQFLGSILHFYSLGWWDTFMHVLSGMFLAFVGIALFERMTKKQARPGISHWFVLLYILSFAVFCGVIWEMYEFSGDQLFGMTMQGGGNDDTMSDLIADTLGGLVVAIFAAVRTKLRFKKDKTFRGDRVGLE